MLCIVYSYQDKKKLFRKNAIQKFLKDLQAKNHKRTFFLLAGRAFS